MELKWEQSELVSGALKNAVASLERTEVSVDLNGLRLRRNLSKAATNPTWRDLPGIINTSMGAFRLSWWEEVKIFYYFNLDSMQVIFLAPAMSVAEVIKHVRQQASPQNDQKANPPVFPAIPKRSNPVADPKENQTEDDVPTTVEAPAAGVDVTNADDGNEGDNE